jgi:hypothetical protein
MLADQELGQPERQPLTTDPYRTCEQKGLWDTVGADRF